MENPKFTKFLAFCQNNGLFSALYALQKQTLSINVRKLREFWIFNFETMILNLEKVFINLEPEGQGGGIIMGVTRLLLLGPFYYIQTKFSILFCTRLYICIVKLLRTCNIFLSLLQRPRLDFYLTQILKKPLLIYTESKCIQIPDRVRSTWAWHHNGKQVGRYSFCP